MVAIYKGDDTGAFNRNFLTINLSGAEGCNLNFKGVTVVAEYL